MAAHDHKALRIIAVFKLFKAIGLLIVAVTAFGLVRQAELDRFAGWIAHLPIQNGHGHLVHALDALLDLGPRQFLAIGIAACAYAALFLTEGWGLWRSKRWAEYLTVVATASLIPFELWEIYSHITWAKVAALVVNIAIVFYLIHVIRERPGATPKQKRT
ncbi:MAG TPA: DUF2127 domain-containing protein [Rudaea sp.]